MPNLLEEYDVQTVHWPSVIRHYRLSTGLKQAALAYDLGVTQTMVSRWEAGTVTPSPRIQERIFELYWDSHASVSQSAWLDYIGRHPSVVGVIDAAGQIQRASRGFLRTLACSRRDLEGRYLSDAFRGDILDVFNALSASGFFEGRVASAESVDAYEYVAPDGSVRGFLGHGLHRPSFLPGPQIFWLLSGAEVSRRVFDDLRRRMGRPFVIRKAL